jgi:hypothetical protein
MATRLPAQDSQPTSSSPAPSTSSSDQQPAANTIDFYGFVMLDAGYEFGQTDPDWFDVVRPTKLPSFKNEFGANGNVYFSVRQTRFGVKTTTPTQFGDLKTQFEFELFGTGVDAGQTTFRLRHAYGELWQFGAGQTWSPFMDIDVFPNSVEYWGPNGMVFFRNVQIRWMPLRTERNEIIVALERPGASADQGVYAGRVELQGIKPHFTMPDISGHVRITRRWGYLQAAGIVRKIGWVDTNPTPTLNLTDHVYGWGVNITSNLTFTENDTARLAVVYGEGIENYMNDAPVDVGVKTNITNPRRPLLGETLPILGIVAFYDFYWSDCFSTALGYSRVDIDNSNGQEPSAFHIGQYALANLLFYPIKNVMAGLEFQWGRRENNSDGFKVDDYRIQFSARYNFSFQLGGNK